jgi:hypothetical protein
MFRAAGHRCQSLTTRRCGSPNASDCLPHGSPDTKVSSGRRLPTHRDVRRGKGSRASFARGEPDAS